MKVGFFSPLPPSRTGVADYSAALLKALSRIGEVEIGSPRADVSLYHLGNNSLHREVYALALQRPGVIVLHDAVLHHFFLGVPHEREYVDEFVYNYGGWTEDLARDLWRRRSRSASDPEYFGYPMLRRVVEKSLGVVVHNPCAAAMVRDHVPAAKIFEIPHLFAPPDPAPAAFEVVRLRQRLGIAAHVFVFAVFGYLRQSKRLATILRAFDRVRREAEVAMLVCGEFVSADLARSLEQLCSGPGIYRIGHTSELDFWRYASAVDACISLRYPAAGETSGISIRLMGLGKPVLVSAGVEVERFPEDACLRIDSGAAEQDMLVQYMTWLARFPADAREVGQRAGAYIGQYHSPDLVAKGYWQALTDCYHRV